MTHHPDIGDPEENFLSNLKMNRALEDQRKRQEEQEARDKEQAEWDAKYPQHAKLRGVKDESQKIGAFLDWAFHHQEWEFQPVNNVADEDNEWPVVPTSIEAILAQYFGIDQQKLSEEKDVMLDEHRKKNNL